GRWSGPPRRRRHRTTSTKSRPSTAAARSGTSSIPTIRTGNTREAGEVSESMTRPEVVLKSLEAPQAAPPVALPVPPAIPQGAPQLNAGQWGVLAFLLSEVALFSTLIVTYIALLGPDRVGPTPAEALKLPLVLCTTVL